MGKVKKYEWVLNENIPQIDDHSLVKLEIIEQYLEIYLHVLTQNHNMDMLKLSIIDGFAGGGIYQGKIAGSPLRIYETINKTKQIINFDRSEKNYRQINFDIDFHYVEKCKNAFKFLEHTLQERGYHEDIYLFNGEFESHLNNLINSIKNKSKRSHRSIFILDQYGYADASLLAIKKIFSTLKSVEVILTFSVDSLIDYLSREKPQVLINMGLSKDDCERIFDLKEDNNFSRSKLQPLLYEVIVKKAGAPFYTPFFIKSDTSNRSYWLFHLSTHSRARDEMMQLHWAKQNTFEHYGRPGLQMLIGYDSSKDHSLFQHYGFDHGSREQSISTLSQELPRLIYEFNNITFSNLKNNILNQTPATIEMIKESIDEHIQYGEIAVTSKEGAKRQKSSTIKDDDVIAKPKYMQSRFIF